MARIYKTCAQWEPLRLGLNWRLVFWLRRLTGRPTWFRLNRFDNRFTRASKARSALAGRSNSTSGEGRISRSICRPGTLHRISKRSNGHRTPSDGHSGRTRSSGQHHPQRLSEDDASAKNAILQIMSAHGQRLAFFVYGRKLIRSLVAEKRRIQTEKEQAVAEHSRLWEAQQKDDTLQVDYQEATDRANELSKRLDEVNNELLRGDAHLAEKRRGMSKQVFDEIETKNLLERLDLLIDTDKARQEIFAPKRDQPTAPLAEEATATRQATPARGESVARATIRRERGEAFERMLHAQEDLEHHQSRYAQARQCFLRGSHPGLPDWEDSWSIEDFDVAYLSRGMELSKAVTAAQEAYRVRLEWARDVQLTPMTHQTSYFPDHPNEAFGPARIDSMDEFGKRRIREWMNEFPSSPPMPEPGNNRTRPSSSPQIDIDNVWESTSATGEETIQQRRIRIAKQGAPRR